MDCTGYFWFSEWQDAENARCGRYLDNYAFAGWRVVRYTAWTHEKPHGYGWQDMRYLGKGWYLASGNKGRSRQIIINTLLACIAGTMLIELTKLLLKIGV